MRRIKSEWHEIAKAEINRQPFNPRARYADLKDKEEITYFAAIVYRARLNSFYRELMLRKRASKKLMEEIRITAKAIASIGLYDMEQRERKNEGSE